MKIIAHRGDIQYGPENTLTAFKSALDNGADAIEFDVHATKDGQIVVHHDYYLSTPSTNTIPSVTFDTIKGLPIKPSEHIPLLQEVFDLIGSKMYYEIELKGFTLDFLRSTLKLAQEYKLLENIEFTSPHPYILSRLKLIEPSVKTGMFVVVPPDWMDTNLAYTITVNNALLGNIDVIHCPVDIISHRLVTLAHSYGLEVHAADCNTPQAISSAQDAQVDQISTNELRLARTLLS